ncbi:VWA domain-containing protein [Tautonia plasticadhaerens]|uniref:von Willebrand factor type A domain protein n=1 Tax=Tautonia plasticadhaerens TaxID=2527974 RepID=A0A518H8P1_9BACT|nr:VWA domain-containing protein [Tautonia plasticadhaerens]QDV37204.1 von Willebrand factor type A domain protein [Tautonia plasticadhaerens]
MKARVVIAAGFTLLLSILLVDPASGQGGDLEDRAEESISRGLEYLRREQSRAGSWDYRLSHDHRLGMTALAGLALLENGVPADDDTLERAGDVVRELATGSDQSYDLSLAILFLSRIQGTTRGDRDDLIDRLARRLEGGHSEGLWSYKVPMDAPGAGSETGGARSFFSEPGDHSNTQFALLGIWAGGRHGFESDAALGALDRHFRKTVNRDGGWGYRPGMGSTPSMTCAGLMALSIAAARPSLAERLSARARGQALADDPVFREALEAVGEEARTIGRRSDVYYLWSLERVCVALGLRDLDGFDWYEAGAESLLERQLPSGGWPNGRWGSLPETCLALLFLRKANLAFELDRVLKLPDPARMAEVTDDLGQGGGPSGDRGAAGGEGGGVIIRQVDESGFPDIALDFEVRDADGSPVPDATESDFLVTEYDQPVEILGFDAPTSREAVQTTVVLVVDHSRSMEAEDRIGALKDSVRTFLGVMPEGSRVAVVAFSDEIRVVCPFTSDVARVREAVDDLQPTGGTRYYDAVVEALELISGESGRRAVLALTDGEDTFSQSADLASAIEVARRAGLPVYTLGLGTEDEIASDDLRQLASQTRGQYFPARDASQLLAIYEEIATRLGEMYRLVYRTGRTLPDGTLRPVTVSYRESAAVGTAEVFIRGMVVPASGWPGLFLALIGSLVGLAILPGLFRKRIATRGVR